MKKTSSWICIMFAAGGLCGAASGFTINPTPASAGIKQDSASAAAETTIVADRDMIRFLIGGKEQAWIDATGLHVNGNIEFTGSMTDTASSRSAETPPAKGGSDAQ